MFEILRQKRVWFVNQVFFWGCVWLFRSFSFTYKYSFQSSIFVFMSIESLERSLKIVFGKTNKPFSIEISITFEPRPE